MPFLGRHKYFIIQGINCNNNLLRLLSRFMKTQGRIALLHAVMSIGRLFENQYFREIYSHSPRVQSEAQ
jgi:hypothetical protein